MGQNSLPTNGGPLIGLGIKMYTGVVALGTSVGVTMVTAAEIQTALDAFIAADGAFNAARSAKQTASEAYKNACEAGYEWLLAARKVLAVRFGARWSTEWAQAGFTNHTTAVPARVEDRLSLILSLVNFFTANPDYEVPSLGLTAAKGTALRNTALAAQQVVTTCSVSLQSLGDAWDGAYAALTAVMRRLIKNLDGVQVLEDGEHVVAIERIVDGEELGIEEAMPIEAIDDGDTIPNESLEGDEADEDEDEGDEAEGDDEGDAEE